VEKAPDAFRTISEVAAEIDVPQHVLRFWESRFHEIRPMKRGGGRRFYRPPDIDLLRGIRHLLYGEGYTIRGVQRILREQGQRFVQNVWQPGAPQPARNIAEEEEAVEEEPAQRDAGAATEPASTRQPQPRPRREESDQQAGRDPALPPVVAPNMASLPSHFASTLQVVIDDLAECRRLLDSANAAGSTE
jgi:DNA-binding transcriptional MerR regulator